MSLQLFGESRGKCKKSFFDMGNVLILKVRFLHIKRGDFEIKKATHKTRENSLFDKIS